MRKLALGLLATALGGCAVTTGEESDRPPAGSAGGQALAVAGLTAAAVGAQMLREDDTIFDRMDPDGTGVGQGIAAAGAGALTGSMVEAARRGPDRFEEYMDESGALERSTAPRPNSPPRFEEWLRRRRRVAP